VVANQKPFPPSTNLFILPRYSAERAKLRMVKTSKQT